MSLREPCVVELRSGDVLDLRYTSETTGEVSTRRVCLTHAAHPSTCGGGLHETEVPVLNITYAMVADDTPDGWNPFPVAPTRTYVARLNTDLTVHEHQPMSTNQPTGQMVSGMRCVFRGWDEEKHWCTLEQGHLGVHQTGHSFQEKAPIAEEVEHTIGLTDAEKKAMELTAKLADLVMGEVIDKGPTSEMDVREFASHIHVIQRTIMSQAAARAHPELYRLLGSTVGGH